MKMIIKGFCFILVHLYVFIGSGVWKVAETCANTGNWFYDQSIKINNWADLDICSMQIEVELEERDDKDEEEK